MKDETIEYLKDAVSSLDIIDDKEIVALAVSQAKSRAAICSELAALRESIDKMTKALPDAEKLLIDVDLIAGSLDAISRDGIPTQ